MNVQNLNERSGGRSIHRAYLVVFKSIPPVSQGLPTDLAYFLEVELRHSVQPVSQLSEVEKFHLKSGARIDKETKTSNK